MEKIVGFKYSGAPLPNVTFSSKHTCHIFYGAFEIAFQYSGNITLQLIVFGI